MLQPNHFTMTKTISRATTDLLYDLRNSTFPQCKSATFKQQIYLLRIFFDLSTWKAKFENINTKKKYFSVNCCVHSRKLSEIIIIFIMFTNALLHRQKCDFSLCVQRFLTDNSHLRILLLIFAIRSYYLSLESDRQ